MDVSNFLKMAIRAEQMLEDLSQLMKRQSSGGHLRKTYEDDS